MLCGGAAKLDALTVANTTSFSGPASSTKTDQAKALIDVVKTMPHKWNTSVTDLENSSKNVQFAPISAAIKLSGFDVVYRAGADRYKPIELIEPDNATIVNVMIMVDRSLGFFDEFGPLVMDGFTFGGAGGGPSGYTEVVDSGDGDFLTQDTLWDFKVSSNHPTKEHTLQLLMYYLMGLRTVRSEFMTITHLGVFNPRLNAVYRVAVSDIPMDVIVDVAGDVIGFSPEDIEDISRSLVAKNAESVEQQPGQGGTDEAGEMSSVISRRERQLFITSRDFGPDHPKTIASRVILGSLNIKAGNFHQAIGLLETALADQTRTLGSNDRSTMVCGYLLGIAYARAQQYEHAIKLLDQTLAAQTQALGRDDSDTLATARELNATRSIVNRQDVIASDDS